MALTENAALTAAFFFEPVKLSEDEFEIYEGNDDRRGNARGRLRPRTMKMVRFKPSRRTDPRTPTSPLEVAIDSCQDPWSHSPVHGYAIDSSECIFERRTNIIVRVKKSSFAYERDAGQADHEQNFSHFLFSNAFVRMRSNPIFVGSWH